MVTTKQDWTERVVAGGIRRTPRALLAAIVPLLAVSVSLCGAACAGRVQIEELGECPSPTGTDAGDAGAIVVDTGVPEEEEELLGAYCPIIGKADYQISIASARCNACVRENCCAEATACLSAGNVGSVYGADGKISACAERTKCQLKCLRGGGAGDSVACEVRCDMPHPNIVSQESRALLDCAFKKKCATDPGGAPLCTP